MTEAERILTENRRRDQELDRSIYAAWQPAELFMLQGRERVAARLLKSQDVFPVRGDRCLEIGFGTRGWLPTLLGWGLDSSDLYGMELDQGRAEVAIQAIPGGHLEIGDARDLPWERDFFQLVVASTVLSSILDPNARQAVAREVMRVLQPGGAILIYDFRFNNPSNPQVRQLKKSEIKALFPGCIGKIRSMTLVPPIARAVAPASWTLATILERLPFLRSHLVSVMVKPEDASPGQTTHA